MQASAKDGADGVLRDEDEGDRVEGDLHRHRHPAAEGGVQAGGERGLQVKQKTTFLMNVSDFSDKRIRWLKTKDVQMVLQT